MIALRRVALMLVVLAATAGGVSVQRDRAHQERMRAAVAARRELAATQLAPAGAAPHAGISARAPIEVPALSDRLARELHEDPDFHRLAHRCGACHATPDPQLHTTAGWDSVVTRMSATIAAAGLLPLDAADRAAVLRVLQRLAGP